MQDVFEPMNFSGEVFEPMSNFGSEVFEPMSSFKGEGGGGNADAYVEAGKQILSTAGQFADASARKKQAKVELERLKSERQRELEACPKNVPVSKLNWKKRNNKIRDCQIAINQRYDEKDKAEREIANKTLDVQKEQIALQVANKKNVPSSSSDKFLGMPKKVGIGVTIGVGVLLLGVTAFLIIRKRK